MYVCFILEYEAITQTAVCYVTQTLEKSMWLDAIGGGEKETPKNFCFIVSGWVRNMSIFLFFKKNF